MGVLLPVRIPTRTTPTRGASTPVTAGRMPAPRVARRITLTVDVLDDGRLRVSSPAARGWAVVARGPHQLWTAARQALVEAQLAGHARWRGRRYDLDALTLPDDPTEPRQRSLGARPRHGVSYGRSAIVRPDQAHPSEWTPQPDGSWLSPRGRTWRDPARIASLVEKRAALGLPTCWADWARQAGRAS